MDVCNWMYYGKLLGRFNKSEGIVRRSMCYM